MKKKQKTHGQTVSKLSLKTNSVCPYQKCKGDGILIGLVDNRKDFVGFCQCHEDKINKNQLKFANLPDNFNDLTISSFDTSLYTIQEDAVINKKVALRYVETIEQRLIDGKGLYFFSTTAGSGKTRLVVSIANELFKKHINIKFITCIDLIDQIKATFNDSDIDTNDILNKIKNVSVLIIDDLGAEKYTDWVDSVIFNILDNRIKTNRPTIITSNYSIENLRYDDRIKSRIGGSCPAVEFPNEDIRRKIAMKENTDLLQDFLRN